MKGQTEIEALIDQFFGDDGSDDPWTKEPIPDWWMKAALRFARIFAPQLTVEDFKNHKARFLGYMAAFMQGVVLQAESGHGGHTPKTEFAQNLNALNAEVAQAGPALLQAVVAGAQGMAPVERTEFFDGYAEGLKRGLAMQGVERLKDSNAAKMCFFLMMVRPWIDARKVESVTEMFEVFCTIHAAFGRPAAPNEAAIASLKTQFSSLCVQCGLKIRGKGRPKSK